MILKVQSCYLSCLSVAIFCVCAHASQVKFTSAVKLSEGGAVGAEYTRDEEENFFKRLGKWRSGRRNPSKLHHTEEKDGRPPPPRGAPHPPTPHRPLSISLSLPVPPSVCPCGVVSCLASQVLV